MEKGVKKVYCIDDAIPVEMLEQLTKQAQFSYGWKSAKSIPLEQQGHWNILLTPGQFRSANERNIALQGTDLSENLESIIKPFWEKTIELFGPRRLCRAYINGYTYGTDAYLHPDTDYKEYPQDHDCKMETVMFYINSTWDPNYAGETVFVENGDIFQSILPKPGRAVCFDSEVLHGARPLSRACYLLRQVLVFKTVVDKYSEENARDFLINLTDQIPHSMGSFYEHLSNTCEILKALKIQRHVYLAGLFHSIYNTEYFQPELNVTREQIQNLIGKRAENLVYQFCTLHPRKQHILSSDTPNQYELAAIEYANILEQSERIDIKDLDYVNQLKVIIKRDQL